MKNFIRSNITLRTGFLNILGSVILMMGFLSACQFGFQPGTEYASLSLTYTPSAASSRTIQPNDQDLTCVKYVIHGLSDSGKTFDIESTETSTVFQNLSCEHWNVTVTGINASTVAIASGSSAITLSVGSTNTLSLTLLPLRQTGSVSINLTVPTDLNVVTVKGELCDGTGVVVDTSKWKQSATIWNYQKQVTSGTYLLRIQGYDSEGMLSFSLYEAVNIVANLTARWDYTVPVDAVNVSVTSIALDQTALKLTLGGASVTVNATLSPVNATDTWVFWSSSNSSVATVDNGVVTAVATGLVTITATSADGTKSSTCSVTVTAPVVLVATVVLDSSSHSLVAGGSSFALIPTISPSNASNKTVTWTTSNSSVATVEAGVVTSVAAGSATITATTSDGGKTAACIVTVTDPVVSVTGLTLDSSSHILVAGGSSFALIPTISPSNASNKTITWTTSNSSVATVDGGVITSVAAGSATITATTSDGGKTATCIVTVTDPVVSVTGVTLDSSSHSLVAGGSSFALIPTISPSNASNKTITWTTSNSSVATVEAGVVTSVAAGSATITATTADGAKTSTCSVTVTAHVISVASLTLNSSTLSLVAGGTSFTLIPTISPLNASNKAVAWSSSNVSVATVNDGVVTPVSVGTANVVATTIDGNQVASCAITVTSTMVPVTSISLTSTAMSLIVGGSSGLLTSIVQPESATNPGVTWTSSNSSVATVSSVGLVQPKAAGVATITVTTNDGGKVATCTVLVGYGILYDSNTSDSGTVPLDNGIYASGASLEVRTNSGNLGKSGYAFMGWNTQPDGKGTSYSPGVQITMTNNLTLYASWSHQASVTITNPSAPDNFSGTIMGAEHLHYGVQTVYTSTYNGNAKTYQWYLNGVPLVGSTASALSFAPVLGLTPYGTNILTLVVRDNNGGLYSGSLTIAVGN